MRVYKQFARVFILAVSFQGKETEPGPLLGLDTYITSGKPQFEVNLTKNKEIAKCQYSNALKIVGNHKDIVSKRN